MTDNEIIKALEYCLAQGITSECERCRDKIGCRDTLLRDALDLINSQKAEIEELIYKLECLLCHATDGKLSKHTYDLKTMEVAVTDAYNEMYTDGYNEGESEARKEFAERLKNSFCTSKEYLDVMMIIDNLLAEMEARE